MFERSTGGAHRLLVLLAMAAACGRQTPVVGPVASATPAPQLPAISDGESLVRAMYDRYQGKWYGTMTFVQKTTIMRGTTPPLIQTWYEALSLPGGLRIDFGDPATGNGVLFRGDSIFNISGGRIAKADTGYNELLVLGFDVYGQTPAKTIAVLRRLGFDLSQFYSANVDGTPVYVVGASSRGDTSSKQFWIERDRLLFVKLIQKNAAGQQSEVRFTDYVPAGNGWVARQVWQSIGGTPRIHEEYSDIKSDMRLDGALFDPRQWSTAKHWTRP